MRFLKLRSTTISLFGCCVLFTGCTTAQLHYKDTGALSPKFKDIHFLDDVHLKDKNTSIQEGATIAKAMDEQTHRSTTLKEPLHYDYSNTVDVTLQTPATEILDFFAEVNGNTLLPQKMGQTELRRRVESISKDRTCFQVEITKKDYYSYQSTSVTPVTTYNSLGQAQTSYVSVPTTQTASYNSKAQASEFKWGGELIQEGTPPVALKFDNGFACARQEISWNKPFSIILGAGPVMPSAVGKVSWYFDPKDQEKTPEHPVAASVGLPETIDWNELRSKTVANAINTDNLKWLKREIPLNQNLSVVDRVKLFVILHKSAEVNDERCPEEALSYLFEAGAIQSRQVYVAQDKKDFAGIYKCLPYAKNAYLWAPELRAKIFAQIHDEFVDNLTEMSPHDSPSEMKRHQDIVAFYKFIHRDLSSECVNGRKDLCVLLDTSEETLRAASAKLDELNRASGRYSKLRALFEQILRNEQERRKHKTHFI